MNNRDGRRPSIAALQSEEVRNSYVEPDVRVVVQNDAQPSHVACAWEVHLSGLPARVSSGVELAAFAPGIFPTGAAPIRAC